MAIVSAALRLSRRPDHGTHPKRVRAREVSAIDEAACAWVLARDRRRERSATRSPQLAASSFLLMYSPPACRAARARRPRSVMFCARAICATGGVAQLRGPAMSDEGESNVNEP